MRTGGQVLIDQLRIQGVDTVFTVPGESFLDALDALYDVRDQIRLVVCRQEGGAANMADAYAKLTGRPGVCLVTRGPGATNSSVGVHTAFQDSSPLVLLIGQVSTAYREREGFQEVDHSRLFSELTKWTAEIGRADRIPEYVSRAFHSALQGRPGPVALALPEDVLAEPTDTDDAGPYQIARPQPRAFDLARLHELLYQAERPFMIVGGGGWSAEASRDVLAFAEANNLPTGASFRCQDYIDNRSVVYAGDVGLAINPNLAQRIKDADFLLALGARLGEATTSEYTLVDAPRPSQTFVHVHTGAEELGRVYQTDLSINSGYAEFGAAARALEPVDGGKWAQWTEAARADYLENLEHPPAPGDLDLGAVVEHLRERLPGDAIIANGAGNFSVWAHRFYQFTQFPTQLGPTSGAMGYGVPAAIAAKVVHSDRIAVCFTGDGDFLMTGQELATAVQYELDPVILLVNNGMYGTIRMHQERNFPARVYGTDLRNPDFVGLAHAYGAHAELVERTEDFGGALERALDAGRASLIELRIDPEQLTPRATLSQIRDSAQK